MASTRKSPTMKQITDSKSGISFDLINEKQEIPAPRWQGDDHMTTKATIHNDGDLWTSIKTCPPVTDVYVQLPAGSTHDAAQIYQAISGQQPPEDFTPENGRFKAASLMLNKDLPNLEEAMRQSGLFAEDTIAAIRSFHEEIRPPLVARTTTALGKC